jgi:nitrite reductase/ring-hydroxylating ferredoxin subunit
MPVTKKLCALADIPEGGAISVDVSMECEAVHNSLMLTRQGGNVHAFRNICPHAGRPLDWSPGQFLVEDGYVICPAHGAMFRLDSGECVSGPCRGASLVEVPVEASDGDVVQVLA